MKKLTLIQDDVLKLIATRFPLSYNDIKVIFIRLKSIDKTIFLLENWMLNPISYEDLINDLNKKQL